TRRRPPRRSPPARRPARRGPALVGPATRGPRHTRAQAAVKSVECDGEALPPIGSRGGRLGSREIDLRGTTAELHRAVDARALHVIRSGVAVVRKEYRDRARDERRAHRRAGAAEVAVADASGGVFDIDG